MAMGAEKLRNSASSTPKTSASARRSTRSEIVRRTSAAPDRCRRTRRGRWTGDAEVGDGLLDLRHGAAEVGAFEAPGDGDEPLQVFAADLVLRRKLLRSLAREPSVAVWPVLLLKTVFWMASSEARVSSAKADANGVGAAVER